MSELTPAEWREHAANYPDESEILVPAETVRKWLDAADERDRLRDQLPEGMKHCTILAKECEKGHAWLTATNWIQHGCPTCKMSAQAATIEGLLGWLESTIEPIRDDAGLEDFANHITAALAAARKGRDGPTTA